MDLYNINIDSCIIQLTNETPCSELGFFSKPYRVSIEGTDFIIKRYHPVKTEDNFIVNNHNTYSDQLREIGIHVPETRISSINHGEKIEFVIIQKAFAEKELLRGLFQESPLEDLITYLQLIYADILAFWMNKSASPIGFHPTLRNYALKNGRLNYFDTFPPMSMKQSRLNQLILQMAPAPNWIKMFIPAFTMNQVSNEYYHLEKMFLGVLGSCIRLRPEHKEAFIKHTKDFVATSKIKDKEGLLKQLNKPPKLSFQWRLIRKLTGNIGQPNVN